MYIVNTHFAHTAQLIWHIAYSRNIFCSCGTAYLQYYIYLNTSFALLSRSDCAERACAVRAKYGYIYIYIYIYIYQCILFNVYA